MFPRDRYLDTRRAARPESEPHERLKRSIIHEFGDTALNNISPDNVTVARIDIKPVYAGGSKESPALRGITYIGNGWNGPLQIHVWDSSCLFPFAWR